MLRRLFVPILALAFASPLYGALTGDIEGTVYDPSGAVVAGAKVTITNLATGAQRVVITNEQGEFAALQLDLGHYRVSVEKSGLRLYAEQAEVRSSEKTRLAIKMTLAARGGTTKNARAATRCAAPERWCHPQTSRASASADKGSGRCPA